jgi:hypothetical protein
MLSLNGDAPTTGDMPDLSHLGITLEPTLLPGSSWGDAPVAGLEVPGGMRPWPVVGDAQVSWVPESGEELTSE